ncbi:MAG: NAD(P)H-binding protein [Streptosporangiaceae bacterium]|nr:NAD(P)H-binding protein [Streptosporangiaceae bacterium]
MSGRGEARHHQPSLYVVRVDATDRAAVSHAMKGADAVISVLGGTGSVTSPTTRTAPDFTQMH